MAISRTLKDMLVKLNADSSNGNDLSDLYPLYIDGQQLPPIATLDVKLGDLYEDGWRDGNAIQHGTLLRKNVRKVGVTWNDITGEDVEFILSLMNNQYINLSYPFDPLTNDRNTINVYVSDRDLTLKTMGKGFSWWKTLKVEFIER